MSEITEKLAVYGSLQPGGVNQHVLEPLRGTWVDGYVFGNLVEDGWGALVGYPGIHLTPGGNKVPVKLFCSEKLAQFWLKLDAFEGDEYSRVVCDVYTDKGAKVTKAWIYALTHK